MNAICIAIPEDKASALPDHWGEQCWPHSLKMLFCWQNKCYLTSTSNKLWNWNHLFIFWTAQSFWQSPKIVSRLETKTLNLQILQNLNDPSPSLRFTIMQLHPYVALAKRQYQHLHSATKEVRNLFTFLVAFITLWSTPTVSDGYPDLAWSVFSQGSLGQEPPFSSKQVLITQSC